MRYHLQSEALVVSPFYYRGLRNMSGFVSMKKNAILWQTCCAWNRNLCRCWRLYVALGIWVYEIIKPPRFEVSYILYGPRSQRGQQWGKKNSLCTLCGFIATFHILTLACNFTRDKSLTFNSTHSIRLKDMGHVYVSPLCYTFFYSSFCSGLVFHFFFCTKRLITT